jgi:act minimal PKS acyl carrier protein
MTDAEFTLADLRRVLCQVAGFVERLDGEIQDVEFGELGYDSLALLETAAAVQRECGIRLDEAALADVRTPRDFLDLVNSQLATTGSA